MENYLNSQQAAEYLQIPVSTLLLYIRQGKIRAAKIGKSYKLTKDEIDRYFNELIDSRH